MEIKLSIQGKGGLTKQTIEVLGFNISSIHVDFSSLQVPGDHIAVLDHNSGDLDIQLPNESAPTLLVIPVCDDGKLRFFAFSLSDYYSGPLFFRLRF